MDNNKMLIAERKAGENQAIGKVETMVMDRDAGASRLDAERERVRGILDRAAPPAECGGGIIAAPARGACEVVRHAAMVPGGVDKYGLTEWTPAATGYGHRASVRAADVFDRLLLQSQKRRGARAPLTPGQIAAARRYRDLSEMVQAGTLKLSKIEGGTGGSDGRDVMDAHMAASEELRGMRRRVGSGAMLSVRRVRPSLRGNRLSIMDMTIIDMMCLGDAEPSQVLKRHGWQPDGHRRKAVVVALSVALDRMIGYRPEKTC